MVKIMKLYMTLKMIYDKLINLLCCNTNSVVFTPKIFYFPDDIINNIASFLTFEQYLYLFQGKSSLLGMRSLEQFSHECINFTFNDFKKLLELPDVDLDLVKHLSNQVIIPHRDRTIKIANVDYSRYLQPRFRLIPTLDLLENNNIVIDNEMFSENKLSDLLHRLDTEDFERVFVANQWSRESIRKIGMKVRNDDPRAQIIFEHPYLIYNTSKRNDLELAQARGKFKRSRNGNDTEIWISY